MYLPNLNFNRSHFWFRFEVGGFFNSLITSILIFCTSASSSESLIVSDWSVLEGGFHGLRIIFVLVSVYTTVIILRRRFSVTNLKNSISSFISSIAVCLEWFWPTYKCWFFVKKRQIIIAYVPIALITLLILFHNRVWFFGRM